MSEASGFEVFARKMRAAAQPELAVRAFARHYEQLRVGATGLLPECDLARVPDLPDADRLPATLATAGERLLPRTVLVQLNGGIGSSMGMEQAKSLLTVKRGLSFLEVVAEQTLRAGVPLLLMNTEPTRADAEPVLARYPLQRPGLPLDFLQHRVPKIDRATLGPVEWPALPDLEWCPPGHGDLYPALLTSGVLDRLLAGGFAYALVCNVDNLGAVVDPGLLGYVADTGVPFLMEVADRTAADRKGGHLAATLGGDLLLREAAQCPPEEREAFQDVARHRYFNTNNLWLHLPSVRARLDETAGVLGLPLIINRKTVDPRDPGSTPVLQLESAMGAAISCFPGARAIRVPRSRFAPVKTTADLLAVRSDAYVLDDAFHVTPAPDRMAGPPDITLDPAFYTRVDDFESRIPEPPSLRECVSLAVRGDVRFGRGVTVRGRVVVEARPGETLRVPDGAVLEG
jgi:UTP--glucose-1-phosphate uridylyltransferase